MTPDRLVVPSSRRRVLWILATAVAVAIIPAGVFGWSAITEVGEQFRAGRVREAELLAAQVDQFIIDAFFELELAAAALAPGSGDGLAKRLETELDSPSLDEATLATLLFDEGGVIVDTRPTALLIAQRDAVQGREVASVVAESTSSISSPFRLAGGKEVVTALGVPIFASNGDRVGTFVGLIDLSGPVMAGFVEPASRIGVTGHADLVDDRGIVLASTNPTHVLGPGDHPEFYAEAVGLQTPVVRSVPHDAGDDVDLSTTHVMAWVPLRNAPWAVALGASESETMAPVTQLRHTLVATGVASLVVLLGGLAVAFRVWPLTPTGAPSSPDEDDQAERSHPMGKEAEGNTS
ncbi:MAG: cache domain-containing protein, partial [Acidimicrobiia bacterium]